MIKKTLAAFWAAIFAFTLLFPLAGCGKDSTDLPTGTFPVSVAGVTIERRPETIVCLPVNYAEAIVDMGYTDLLDGRPGDTQLAQLQAIQPCGTAASPATENIINMGTDLIIVDMTTPIETLQQFSDAGITVLQLIEPSTRTGFLNLYRCLGTAMNGNGAGYDAGEAAAQKIITQLDTIERTVMNETPVNVCLYTAPELNQCITGDMFPSFLIEMAGGFNINIESVNGYCDMETILYSCPDIILCPIGAENYVRSQREFKNFGAIKNNRIYGYDISRFDSLGEDLVLATWELAHLFHPSVVSAEDLPYGAVDYYPTYDGTVIVTTEEEYNQMLEEQAAATATTTAN